MHLSLFFSLSRSTPKTLHNDLLGLQDGNEADILSTEDDGDGDDDDNDGQLSEQYDQSEADDYELEDGDVASYDGDDQTDQSETSSLAPPPPPPPLPTLHQLHEGMKALRAIKRETDKLPPRETDTLPPKGQRLQNPQPSRPFLVEADDLVRQRCRLQPTNQARPNQPHDLNEISEEKLSSIAEVLRKVSHVFHTFSTLITVVFRWYIMPIMQKIGLTILVISLCQNIRETVPQNQTCKSTVIFL